MKFLTTIIFLIGMLTTSFANADLESEREALARLAHELKAIGPLIHEAEQQADPTNRIKFQYNWLKQDLAKVTQGIEGYLNNPRAEPRQVEPLQGDYRR